MENNLSLENEIDRHYFYIDLEVNSHQEITQIAIAYLDKKIKAFQNKFEELEKILLKKYSEKKLYLCGHNFRRFDLKYLQKQYPTLEEVSIIDTLELSALAFPLQPTHRLTSDHKNYLYGSKDPLEDALRTKRLLEKITEKLATKPSELVKIYRWLLTCGNTNTDLAYRHYFSLFKNITEDNTLSFDKIPPEILKGLNQSFIQKFLAKSTQQSFDTRLSLAACIAWNYDRNLTKSLNCYPRWLVNLPEFYQVFHTLFQLSVDESSLKNYASQFQINQLQEAQEKAIQAILNHQNPLVLIPNGSSKSLCYQISAKMLYDRHKALTVVILPSYQAVMADRVADLQTLRQHFATFINKNLSSNQRAARFNQILDGHIGLLYLSAEQLRSPSIKSLLEKCPPTLWVIDEAHCLSKQGHDFRSDYQYILPYIQQLYQQKTAPLPSPNLAFMTATATAAVVQDLKKIGKKFGFEIKQEIATNLLRENLNYQVFALNNELEKENFIVQQVKKYLAHEAGILVYTITRKNTEKLSTLLNQSDIEARHYHGSIPPQAKEEIQKAFKSGELNVVISTCAFRMGINRHNIRSSIHHTISSSLENYFQETDHAGCDGKFAKCVLLFDTQDAETIFFLQSLNQLSKTDLGNIFNFIRNLRDKLTKSKTEKDEWLWVTLDELYQNNPDSEDFGFYEEQFNRKIKTALYYLESFGLIEIAEESSNLSQLDLKHNSYPEALVHFENYLKHQQINPEEATKLKDLMTTLHLIKSHYPSASELIPVEIISDQTGLPLKTLTTQIKTLEQADICNFKLPLVLLITKGVAGDANKNHQTKREIEKNLLNLLLELQKDKTDLRVNLRGLASRLDPLGNKKIRAGGLKSLMKGWAAQGWVTLSFLSRDLVCLENLVSLDQLEDSEALTSAIIEAFYEKLNQDTGARLKVESEFNELVNQITALNLPFPIREKDIESALFWLHSQKIIRITEGINLFTQSLKLRVVKNANISSIASGYTKQLQPYYELQTKKVHAMLHYGSISDGEARRQFVQDYFSLSNPIEFSQRYRDLTNEFATLPVTKDDYHRIINNLNEIQKKIVFSESSAISVIAGPGSGKTRTIVHRIAYLIKVKRVEPNRILVLAYNRNAVNQLKIRLQSLIGTLSAPLRVFTFHSLALTLLGRTFGSLTTYSQNDRLAWDKLLKQACDLIEKGDSLEDEDTQVRRVQLLGNLEYIFVDEYQDVAHDEYRLIQLLAGLNESEDKAKKVQINLCVIGDDDQNIYEFKGTTPKYITQFEKEYQAEQFLLVENYRSPESIIESANRLIQNNKDRSKKLTTQQVQIDQKRLGLRGKEITGLMFPNISQQAAWVADKIETWIATGTAPNQIAILARNWNELSPVRLLLEKSNIQTYALKQDSISLLKNRATYLLTKALKKDCTVVLTPEESVQERIERFFLKVYGNLQQPTIQTIIQIAKDLDQERGYGTPLALPICVDEILTAIFEFNQSGETYIDNNSVLVTSCHGAKGLEFCKVILLTDGFRTDWQPKESERRLFYVAMTRAKEELLLTATVKNTFVQEAGVTLQNLSFPEINLPRIMNYIDFSPADVHLSYQSTRNNRPLIESLQEGTPLQLKTNRYGNGWAIFTQEGFEIGSLSKKGTQTLIDKQLIPGDFEFSASEVTVKYIYHHLKFDEVTEQITEDWFVVIPQIRICRS